VRFSKDVEVTGRCRRGVRERVEVKKESVEGTVGEREARAGLEEEFLEERRRQRRRVQEEEGHRRWREESGERWCWKRMVQRRRRKAGSVGELGVGAEAGTTVERQRERMREEGRSMAAWEMGGKKIIRVVSEKME
jgi:hypothetical protein